jgi:hypothetical protein
MSRGWFGTDHQGTLRTTKWGSGHRTWTLDYMGGGGAGTELWDG